jgi:invasion protein IalB
MGRSVFDKSERKKFMKKILLFCTLIFCSSAFSGGSEGLVATPLANSEGMMFFSAGSHLNAPSCSVETLGTWAIDCTSSKSKAMCALVMSAHAQGKRLHVQGKNNCDLWGDRESVSYLFIVD